ncbi:MULTISPECIES: response regulator [unclassified Streptomyces]|uniref:response regulator n=1 Tax=unclassified Streptomyces TaxID=2593676 RepID=UPI00226EA7BB|nr:MULTISPECIES: response regulator [unclassified Streptomyces]MCY0924376.1 response regulator [Streptomyces sp. H27-G5]MCY0963453.1 response regulator [Streptomyces sp. H27-H5]
MVRVLVVEDDFSVRAALIRHLSETGHTVRSVGTARAALREVSTRQFDVVVLGLGLPDLDGSEALKMMRGITDIPVIIATARDDEAEIVRLLNSGADDYLAKPFSVEQLSAGLSAVLRRARPGEGNEEQGGGGLNRRLPMAQPIQHPTTPLTPGTTQPHRLRNRHHNNINYAGQSRITRVQDPGSRPPTKLTTPPPVLPAVTGVPYGVADSVQGRRV